MLLRTPATRSLVAVLGTIGYLAFIARALLDWRFVYQDFVSAADLLTTTLSIAFYLAVSAVWLWALFGVRDGRRAGYLALIGLSAVLLVAGAVATWFGFCSFVCQTAFPLMETANTGGAVIGLVTIVVARRARPADA